MKIVIISDTHGRHQELGILEGDILIHCGDVCFGYTAPDHELDAIDQWFAQQHFSHILCIGGNHDRPLQQRASVRQAVFQHAIYLEDETFEFNGIKFYASPWVPDLQGWAYYQNEEILKLKWEQIPTGIDVLITHTPPKYILDSPRNPNLHLGCPHLRDRIEIVQPKIHCFGHNHASYGQNELNGTLFINASIVSQGNINKPVTIEL